MIIKKFKNQFYSLEYAVLRLLGVSGLQLYKNAASAAVRIKSYNDEHDEVER